MKAPALVIMPGDIRRDPALRACSLAARGLWSEIWYLAHEGEPYGAVRINGSVLGIEDLSYQVGRPIRETRAAFRELQEKGIPVIFQGFAHLLQSVRLTSLYWLEKVPGAESSGRGNHVENLRMPVENGKFQPPLTPPLTPPSQLALPSPFISPFPESSLAGCIMVRRMIRDEERRRNGKKTGKLGGNPALRTDKGGG